MTVSPLDPTRPGALPDRPRLASKKRLVAQPAQCRAARAWIGWTQDELARQAGLARKTIADFERGRRTLLYRSQETITAALERAGVEFLWGDDVAGEGVTVRESGREGR